MNGAKLVRKELREFVDGHRQLWSARVVALSARRGLRHRGLDVLGELSRLTALLQAGGTDADVAHIGIRWSEARAAYQAINQLECRAWLLSDTVRSRQAEDLLARRRPGQAAFRLIRIRALRRIECPGAPLSAVRQLAVRFSVDLDSEEW